MNILKEKIQTAMQEKRLALVPFVTAGFPNEEKFWEVIYELDNSGADIIEIGVPFSDPMADGPIVEDASRRALENGVTLEGILKGLLDRKGTLKVGIILMGYMNPFHEYGFEKMAKDAKDAGVHGFIIPDLPFEEFDNYVELLEKEGLAFIPLIGLNTSEERMLLYTKCDSAYVYIVSTMGTTGSAVNLTKSLSQTMQRARKVFNTPLALGFGLKEPAQLESIPKEDYPDAVIFGSALLQDIDSGKSVSAFMAKWTQ